MSLVKGSKRRGFIQINYSNDNIVHNACVRKIIENKVTFDFIVSSDLFMANDIYILIRVIVRNC